MAPRLGRLAAAGLLLFACYDIVDDGRGAKRDAGLSDSGTRDAGLPDAGGDTGHVDAMGTDDSAPDTGSDASFDDALDGALPSDGSDDAGTPDAGWLDAAAEAGIDTDPEDAGGPDVSLPNRCNRAGARDCGPGPGGGYCPDGPSEFSRDVNGAIDAAMAGHPEWFVADGYAACCPLVLPEHVDDYLGAVTDHLDASGLCASGPAEEIGVKFNNECSEAWDILANPDAETNLVRRHYVGNCLPSFF